MRWLFLILLLTLAGPAVATPGMPIPAYTATYEAHLLGNRLVALSTLSPEGGNLRMAMDAHVSGFVRILGRFEFNRESLLQAETGGVRLLQTRTQQITPRRDRTVETRFDWTTDHAHGHINGETFAMEVPPQTQDFLSSLYLIMLRLRNGEFEGDITVDLLERDRLRRYSLEHRGKERIDTPMGVRDTVQIVRKDNSSDVELAAWFAPDLHYLPVRFDYETNGTVYQLDLTQVEWHEPLIDPQRIDPESINAARIDPERTEPQGVVQ